MEMNPQQKEKIIKLLKKSKQSLSDGEIEKLFSDIQKYAELLITIVRKQHTKQAKWDATHIKSHIIKKPP